MSPVGGRSPFTSRSLCKWYFEIGNAVRVCGRPYRSPDVVLKRSAALRAAVAAARPPAATLAFCAPPACPSACSAQLVLGPLRVPGKGSDMTRSQRRTTDGRGPEEERLPPPPWPNEASALAFNLSIRTSLAVLPAWEIRW
eukprot:CAMPEP_0115304938 /NCGR_PEP_ID=MMETSP0270-20121206/71740_1 /TAXON_ID=71861 /ORGANISM="Scrippsiella trochoidea, Strain CCMP3099" /LENGTH=140 /DNA_ID=CAMNT_0002723079 /DNA_START=278 /DNA_END=700 /DNA_ORIENTATION=-